MIRILSKLGARRGLLTLALLALPFGGCALTNKAVPTIPRYFSPELPPVQPRAGAPRAGAELRLGRITASSHIREKIVYRSSDYEVGFYDDLLWTEKPVSYLRRALSQVLFEQERLRSVVSGAAPVLDVELVSFEELRAPRHAALVRLTFVVRDERMVRLEQTLSVERPIAAASKDQEPAAIAAALGEAMRSAVAQVSERVIAELGRPPAPPVSRRPAFQWPLARR